MLKKLWRRYVLWNNWYCFKHKEFSCMTCGREKKVMLKKEEEAYWSAR